MVKNETMGEELFMVMRRKKVEKNKKKSKGKCFGLGRRTKLFLIGGLAVIGVCLLVLGLGKWGFAAVDRGIRGEQEKILEKNRVIINELDQQLQLLDGKLQELEEDQLFVRRGRKELTMDERRQWLVLLGEIDNLSFDLGQECEAYDNDVSVQFYPYRDFGVDQVIGKMSYIVVPVEEMVRRGEIMMMGETVNEDQAVLMRSAVERVREWLEITKGW